MAGLSEFLMLGGPHMHLLLSKLQALAGKGSLTAAVANHMQNRSRKKSYLHPQKDRTAAELEAKLMK